MAFSDVLGGVLYLRRPPCGRLLAGMSTVQAAPPPPVGDVPPGGGFSDRKSLLPEVKREQITVSVLLSHAAHVSISIYDAGACYNTDDVASRQERQDLRARASRQALGRGDSGCAMSPVEMARAMAGLLRMHQSELEMQVDNFTIWLREQGVESVFVLNGCFLP